MENNKYLNEENYQRSKKKVVSIAIIILVLGILIGGGLIGFGISKSSSIKAPSTQDIAKEKESIQSKKDELNNELATLKAKQNQEFKANGISEDYYRLSNEISKKQNEVNKLDTQIWKLEHEDSEFDVEFEKSKYIPFYMIGGFIIISSFMISLSVYTFAKRREILAFSAQQVMPVAKEGIDEIAPTIGKAGASIAKEMAPVYGNIAKEIGKGIKEGINEADKEK